jgi:hypothetical protein
MQGIVERIQRDERHGHIRSDDGRAFYFEPNELANSTWEQLLLGTKVDFDVDEPMANDGPKAKDIHVQGEVKPIAPDEMPTGLTDNPDAGAIATQVPPTTMGSKQDEASWESFPASDSPAAGKST